MLPFWPGRIRSFMTLRLLRCGKLHFVLFACPLTLALCSPEPIMMLSAQLHALLWGAVDR